MNILVLTKRVAGRGCGGYQGSLLAALGRRHQLYCYGPGHPGYRVDDDVHEVLAKCPFRPDLVLVGTSWEEQSPDLPRSDPHPPIRLAELGDTPKAFFLNKEYKKLAQKLDYVRSSRFDIVFSFHHDCRQWEGKTGCRFHHVPFAVDPHVFHDYGLRKRFEFGFSGGLHRTHTDLRFRIKQLMFADARLPSTVGLRYRLRGNPLRDGHRTRRVYWVEWGAKSMIGRPLIKQGRPYAKVINRCRAFLCTPSAAGLIGTRFYEVMASGALAFCPRGGAYDGLFEAGRHCVLFEPDLSDFEDGLDYYLAHEEERAAICRRAAMHVMAGHTWEHRVEYMTEVLSALVNGRTGSA